MPYKLNNLPLLMITALCTFNFPVSALNNPLCSITAKNQKLPEDIIVSFKVKRKSFDPNQKSHSSYLHISPDGLLNVLSDSPPLVLSDEEINALIINTQTDLESAQLTALNYESIAEYEAAEKLYRHMLNVLVKLSSANETMRYDLVINLTRVKLWEAADYYEYNNERMKSALNYRQILLTISSNRNIDLETKLKFVSTIIRRLARVANDKHTRKVYYQAKHLYDVYKKQIASLQIVADLDRSAWRLEHLGLYERAEKVYKQSLSIKEKSLGKNNQNTLAARLDLARLYAGEQRYLEAKSIYEGTLALYKKIANAGQSYVALLENYGDVLNHINQTNKANEIYNEVRIAHSEL